ncbi:hypothetical protein [Belliella aquatica]|nr:hypothetical protein [Belliella aquatica]
MKNEFMAKIKHWTAFPEIDKVKEKPFIPLLYEKIRIVATSIP